MKTPPIFCLPCNDKIEARELKRIALDYFKILYFTNISNFLSDQLKNPIHIMASSIELFGKLFAK